MSHERPASKLERPYQGMREIARYYDAHTLQELNLAQLPSDVLDYFEDKSGAWIHPDDYKAGDFLRLLRVENADGSEAFVSLQDKHYKSTTGDTERIFIIFERLAETKIGNGEVRYNLTRRNDPRAYAEPFVGWTETSEGFKGRGYGTRRLKLMNALAHAEFGQPLCSTHRGGQEEFIWKRLVEQGEAKVFGEGEERRYVMTTQPKDI